MLMRGGGEVWVELGGSMSSPNSWGCSFCLVICFVFFVCLLLLFFLCYLIFLPYNVFLVVRVTIMTLLVLLFY